MATPDTSLAFIGAPLPILILALLLVGLFAPQLLPKIGRMLGRMVRAEALRRLGFASGAARSVRPAAPASAPREEMPARTVEVLMPDRPTSTLRARSEESLATERRSPRSAPFWLVSGAVVLVAAAIFWFLLHSR